MRTRHRMPMIFSLSMMDVFCCTLGCVILLWLINQREAMLRTKSAQEALEQLTDARATLVTTSGERDSLQRQLNSAQTDLSSVQRQSDALRADLAAARVRADELLKQLGIQKERTADVEDRLVKKSLSEQQMIKLRAETLKQIADLERMLKDRDSSADTLTRKSADLTERLAAAETRIAQLKKQAELLPEVRDTAVAADAKAKSLEKDLAAARAALEGIRGENRDLGGQLARVKAAAENRFEGITLTGRRVVFLVDMSGSMEMVDEKTTDAAKWPGVRESLLRIMRSLPNLEKFQVILFSDKTSYLLGGDGRWFDYDANSATKVGEALAATRPQGNTNMYVAMDAAFQFRAQGLDTIYLFSDGLPNIGEGLAPDQLRTMNENQRSEVLSRVIRSALKTKWNRADGSRPRVRINAIGFFYESPDVGAFLWALARENDGSFVGMSRP
jgi:hypothetical protein